MDELAAELGMSKKTLYQQFRSKDELLLAAIDAKFSQVDAELAAVMAQPDRPMPVRLKDLLTTLQRHIHEIHPAFIRDVQRSDPALFQMIDDRRQAIIRKHFGALLDQGRREGAVRRDLPVDVMVEILLAAARTLVNPARLVQLNLSPQKAFSQVLEIFLHGILAKKDK